MTNGQKGVAQLDERRLTDTLTDTQRRLLADFILEAHLLHLAECDNAYCNNQIDGAARRLNLAPIAVRAEAKKMLQEQKRLGGCSPVIHAFMELHGLSEDSERVPFADI